MKPIVILLLLIAVVAILYFGALGVGFARNGSGSGKSTSMEDMSGAWLDALGSLGAWFAPKLELERLKCNNQPVAKLFRLSEARANDPRDTCALSIDRSSEDDYRKAELRTLVVTPGTPEPAVYIHADFDVVNYPRAEHEKECANEADLEPFRIEVTFVPGDKSDGDTWECWLQQKRNKPVALTVLKDGGVLTLTCKGCSASARQELVLQMK